MTVDKPLSVNILAILSGSSLTHSASNTNGLQLHVTGDAVVESGGAISVDGRGYRGGNSKVEDNGLGGSHNGTGASHGGLGGADNYNSATLGTYGR